MKTRELRQKTEKELKDLLINSQHKLGQIKFDLAFKKVKNVKQIKELRRDVARIKTLLNNG